MEKLVPYSQAWKDKISQTKGPIWSDVQRYAQMRMTPQEILIALELENKPRFPYERVENALNKAWKRGLLERRTPEERADSRIGVLPQNRRDLRREVALWLKVGTEVDSGRIQAYPTTRMEWKELLANPRHSLTYILPNPDLMPEDPTQVRYLLDLYQARMALVETGDRTLMNKLSDDYDAVDPDIAERLISQIEIIRGMTSRKPDVRIYNEGIIAINSEPDR